MTTLLLRFVTLASFALGAYAHAAAPASVSATYEVRMNGVNVAVIDESYRAQAGAYRLTSNSTPIGVFALAQKLAVRFSSSGALTPRGLQPQRFEGRRGNGDTPELSADFDWTAARLTLTHEGKNQTVELAPGTQDRLSAMYEFMFLAPKASGALEVPVTNGRRVNRYAYAVTRDVELDTPLGRLKTVHLVKQREPGDPENEIWLSAQHGYVPVRMIIVERDGRRYEQLATKLELQP